MTPVRPTMEMVKEAIQSVTYTRLPSGTAIVCEITMKNNHCVHGIAVVCDLAGHNEARGKEVAYGKAVDKVFGCLSYDLHNMIADGRIESQHTALMAAYPKQPVLLEN